MGRFTGEEHENIVGRIPHPSEVRLSAPVTQATKYASRFVSETEVNKLKKVIT